MEQKPKDTVHAESELSGTGKILSMEKKRRDRGE